MSNEDERVSGPTYPCRLMQTRPCPAVYEDVCGDRPCARFESHDETPWLGEMRFELPYELDAEAYVRLDAVSNGLPTVVHKP